MTQRFKTTKTICSKNYKELVFIQFIIDKNDEKRFPVIAQPAITCSKLAIETLDQGTKYV